MNNEPVAYIDPYDLERLPHYDCHIGSQQLKNGIPLYTHPAKELTDEYMEMLKTCKAFEDYLIGPTAWTQEQEDSLVTKVRTIIRKTQEK